MNTSWLPLKVARCGLLLGRELATQTQKVILAIGDYMQVQVRHCPSFAPPRQKVISLLNRFLPASQAASHPLRDLIVRLLSWVAGARVHWREERRR